MPTPSLQESLALQEAEIARLREEQRTLKAALKAERRAEKDAAREARRQKSAHDRNIRKLEREALRLAKLQGKEERRQAAINTPDDTLPPSDGTRPHDLSSEHAAFAAEVAADALRHAATFAAAGFTKLSHEALRLARASGEAAGRASVTAYEFVDGDVRSQFKEAPLLGLMQLLPYDPVPYRQPLTEHPPLVMIHGLAGSAGNFAGMRLWLALHRARPVHVFDYREYNDIFPAADAFSTWLDDVLRLYPETPVEILAHSMGGLLTRLALLDKQRAARIGQVLTLGTPHHGTNLARWGGANYVRQLRMDSPVFQKLRAEETSPLPYALTSIWTKRDVMVLPPEQSIFDTTAAYPMHDTTHLGWLVHPRFMEDAFNQLDAQRLAYRKLVDIDAAE